MKYLYNDPELKEWRRELRKHMTSSEHLLWSRLRGRRFLGLKFHRQYSIERFILDFYCPEIRVGIELDGFQHRTELGLARDEERGDILQMHNISIIRFLNDELTDLERVVHTLSIFCTDRLPLEYKRERGS